MILRLVLRTLFARPVRSAVLAGGFGFGIAVMAVLLGVGEVMVEQGRSPALRGGGDVLVMGQGRRVESARYLLSSVLSRPPFADRVTSASPSRRASLYLVRGGAVTRIRARGGVPSLERALGDPETSAVAAWQDAPFDRPWAAPDPGEALRALDRFHPIPEVPARADSWAEWLYFNGRTADGTRRFYLSFIVGPRTGPDTRSAVARLQLEESGREARSFRARADVPEARLIEKAPDLDISGNSVRLEGLRYRMRLDLRAEDRGPGLTGDITLDAIPGRSIPPLALRGAGGWVSGYVVPVLSGPLGGTLSTGRRTIPLDGATGYHDHNWGFWRGVSWQWGQVAHEGLAFLYGRVRPPADAADPERIPGFLVVTGPEGLLGFAREVAIAETDSPESGRPREIRVHGRGAGLDVRMLVQVEDAIRTPLIDAPRSLDFLQLRALFRVTGRAGGRSLDFVAPGSAETFRGG